jgi:L-malate glycosyltransferase
MLAPSAVPSRASTPEGRRRLRVVFLSSCVLGGGAGWSFYYLLKHLDRRVIEPVVIVPAEGIFCHGFRELDVPVRVAERLHHRTNELRFRRATRLTRFASYALNVADQARFIVQLARLLRREKVDLVYCNNMMVETVGALAAQLAGTACVLHARNLHEQTFKVLLYGMLARLPATRRVIANSEASAAPYRRYAVEKVAVVHNGVDLTEYTRDAVARGSFRAELGVGGNATIVGFTGWLIPRKGIDLLLRAAALLLPTRPNLTFVAVGGVPPGSPIDYRADYEQLARDLGIAERFRFAGFRDDVRPAVIDFDVLVLPSRQEPFGRSIIEAMALGTAVVASRVGGIPEILTDGRTGLLVPVGDVEKLAAAIASLIDEPERRAALAQEALREVRERFDVAQLSRRVQSLLIETAAA